MGSSDTAAGGRYAQVQRFLYFVLTSAPAVASARTGHDFPSHQWPGPGACPGGSTISSRGPSRTESPLLASGAQSRRLDRGDVYLFHWHHRFERAFGRCGIVVGERGNKGARGNLPRHAPPVLTPATLAFLAAILHDRIPQAVGFGLVVGRDLKRERLVMLELRPAIKPDAGDANHSELDRQDIALLAVGIVARRAEDCAHGAVGEGLSIEASSVYGSTVIPQTDRVLAGHCRSPMRVAVRFSRFRLRTASRSASHLPPA